MYSPIQKDKEPQTVAVESVSLMLGREIIDVGSARAGTVVAIRINNWIQHSTLLSEPLQTSGLNFDNTGLEPLVRVTGEFIFGLTNFANLLILVRTPGSGTAEMQELRQALKQLAILDSAVRVFEQEDGDLALVVRSFGMKKRL